MAADKLLPEKMKKNPIKAILQSILFLLGVLVAVLPAMANEIWVAPSESVTHYGNWGTTPSGSAHFTFGVPNNFTSFTSAKILVVPSKNLNLKYNLTITVARNGQSYTNDLTSYPNISASVSATSQQLLEIDVSDIISQLPYPLDGGFDHVSIFFSVATAEQQYTKVLGLRFAYDGPMGPQGAAGATGPKGATGPVGATGITGQQGIPGSQGSPGIAGHAGAPGTTGLQGDAGPAGPAGPSGATGATGPAGLTWQGPFNPGTSYNAGDVVSENGSSFVSRQSNNTGNDPANDSGANWGLLSQTGAVGPTGAAGAIGPTGPQGVAGTAGAIGPTGAAGPLGTTGPMGPQGPTGLQGIPGLAGAVGPAGATGATGSTGPDIPGLSSDSNNGISVAGGGNFGGSVSIGGAGIGLDGPGAIRAGSVSETPGQDAYFFGDAIYGSFMGFRRDSANLMNLDFYGASGWFTAANFGYIPNNGGYFGGGQFQLFGKTFDQTLTVSQYAYGWAFYFNPGSESSAQIAEFYVPYIFSVASAGNSVHPLLGVRDKNDGADISLRMNTDTGYGEIRTGNAESGYPEYTSHNRSGLQIIVDDGANYNTALQIEPTGTISAPVTALGTPVAGSTVGLTGQVDTVTVANNCTIDLSTADSTWPASGNESKKTLYLTNGGAATVIWSGVTWEGTGNTSTPPTLLASGVNCLLFVTVDGGSTVYGLQIW